MRPRSSRCLSLSAPRQAHRRGVRRRTGAGPDGAVPAGHPDRDADCPPVVTNGQYWNIAKREGERLKARVEVPAGGPLREDRRERPEAVGRAVEGVRGAGTHQAERQLRSGRRQPPPVREKRVTNGRGVRGAGTHQAALRSGRRQPPPVREKRVTNRGDRARRRLHRRSHDRLLYMTGAAAN